MNKHKNHPMKLKRQRTEALTLFFIVIALGVILGSLLIVSHYASNPNTESSPSTLAETSSEVVIASEVYVTTTSELDVSLPVFVTPTQIPTFEEVQSLPEQKLWVEETLTNMSLEQKIGQLYLIGISGTEISAETCQRLQSFRPGGIVLLGGNVLNPDQLRLFTHELQSCMQRVGAPPLLISIDHEGQYVNRFDSGTVIFPSNMAIGASNSTKNAYDVAYSSGQELKYAGVNFVLGPVADVLTDLDNYVISVRSYGSNVDMVNKNIEMAVAGYLEAGLIASVKHFPGHGSTPVDSHTGLPVDASTHLQIEQINLPPFRAAIARGVPIVMMDHVVYSAFDTDQMPASLSAPIYTLLRDELNFKGVVMTDAMDMGAITATGYSNSEAGLVAVQAGADLLLYVSSSSAVESSIDIKGAIESGVLDIARIDESVRRILNLKMNAGLEDYVLPSVIVDWDLHREVADDVSYHAVGVLRNSDGLIPIPGENKSIYMVAPRDVWGLTYVLENKLSQYGHTLTPVYYSDPWAGSVPETYFLDSVPNNAPFFDLVLVFTWDSHLNSLRFGDEFQSELVAKLQNAGVPLIVISLKSPTDILDFPNIGSYIASYGTVYGQLQAIADILVGEWQPDSINPIE